MLNQITQFLRKPSAAQLAQAELDEARRELLAAHGALDYTLAMVDYHQARITRLELMLGKEHGNA